MKRHGTSSSYRSGCRCDDCKDWKAESAREYRRANADANRPDAEPVRFQVEASCKNCGGALTLVANGRPTPSGSETRASVQCVRKGCRHLFILATSLTYADGREFAS